LCLSPDLSEKGYLDLLLFLFLLTATKPARPGANFLDLLGIGPSNRQLPFSRQHPLIAETLRPFPPMDSLRQALSEALLLYSFYAAAYWLASGSARHTPRGFFASAALRREKFSRKPEIFSLLILVI